MEFTWIIIIALLIFGLLFVIAEVLVVPGTTLVGILGGGLMAVGVYGAYTTFGMRAGHLTVLVSVVLSTVVLYFSFKYGTWKQMGLGAEIDSKVNVIDVEDVVIGDKGVAVSRLAPSGKAKINNKYFEVHTFGEFVDENTKIEVVKRDSNKVFVKSIK